MINTNKPLGAKAYGSIPHLPGSRVGPGDYHIHEGQAKIATEKPRDRHDLVIVQEKLDGSNTSVVKLNNNILALTRAGYLAETSPYLQHHIFATWVERNHLRFRELLREGERVCGEWLALAHGTRYKLPHEPFVPFDLMTGKKRMVYEQFAERVLQLDFVVPNLLHIGPPLSVEVAMIYAETRRARHGAIDKIEGAVWRVERKGAVDFLCKYVRPDKVDGCYLPENNGDVCIWNIDVASGFVKLTK